MALQAAAAVRVAELAVVGTVAATLVTLGAANCIPIGISQ